MYTRKEKRLIERMRKGGIKYPKSALTASRRTGCPLSLGCALLQMESSGVDKDGTHKIGLNLFGRDPVKNPVKGGFVTLRRYREYKRNRKRGLGMQGVGPCQLTWYEFQDNADRLGGCHRPLPNMLVGFAHVWLLVKRYGMHNGLRRYNGAGVAADRYATRVNAYREKWHDYLKGA